MMTDTSNKLTEKIAEVYAELKKTALWKAEAPDWVYHYQKVPATEVEFSDWLQFVFLPNKVKGNKMPLFESIAPQAVRFFGKELSKGKLLQLLVELDSLTD